MGRKNKELASRWEKVFLELSEIMKETKEFLGDFPEEVNQKQITDSLIFLKGTVRQKGMMKKYKVNREAKNESQGGKTSPTELEKKAE